jgi:hypothetical protein
MSYYIFAGFAEAGCHGFIFRISLYFIGLQFI